MNENISKKQLATALYFIDNFALRVGGKNTKEKQIMLCNKFTCRHLTLLNRYNKIRFLRKDSIRY